MKRYRIEYYSPSRNTWIESTFTREDHINGVTEKQANKLLKTVSYPSGSLLWTDYRKVLIENKKENTNMCSGTVTFVRPKRVRHNALDAIVKRINRKLANANVKLHVTANKSRMRKSVGQFYVTNLITGELVKSNADVFSFAKEYSIDTNGIEPIYGNATGVLARVLPADAVPMNGL